MKFKNIEARQTWEVQHRRRNPHSKQSYELASDLRVRQEAIEKSIQDRKNMGFRLNKTMRSYLRSKERYNNPVKGKYIKRSRKNQVIVHPWLVSLGERVL